MPPESPSLQAPRQLPLVGRDEAWQNLLAAWRAVAGGRSQVVIVSGEAGIGKTRLAEELIEKGAGKILRDLEDAG